MDFAATIAALRSQLPADSPALAGLAVLETGLQPYQGLDATAARAALETLSQGESAKLTTQITGLTAANAELLSSNRSLQAQLLSTQTLAQAGVLPGYEELFLGQAQHSITFADDGTPTLPETFVADYKAKYPAVFAAMDAVGAGTTAAGDAATKQPTTVTPVGGVISGVDPKSLMDGTVKLSA